jgi:uncharacterized repeat protein (TIGR01451 family)
MKRCLYLSVLIGFFLLSAQVASAQSPVPSFAKAFSPTTIGPGGVSTLTFTITNNTGVGVRGPAFTDTLPAGMTLASPANPTSDCGGASVDAPDGGSTITFSGTGIPNGTSCTVTVNVTAAAPGTYTNVSGDLTSDAGNSGSATDDLTVATDRPGFTKSFSPSSIFLGGRSTLTFTIDNTANTALAANLRFTDNLPTGMVIASPANASTTCTGGTLSAPAGGTVIAFGQQFPAPTVAAGASCTVSVDVLGNAAGVLGNTSGELTSTGQFGFPTNSSGKAAATLTVTVEKIALSKTFTNDPVAPGGTVNLQFTIRNLDRRSDATNIAFTDDLDATLSGLVATGLPAAACGGTLSGSGLISLSGGTLAAEQTCTFAVTLQVPSGATPGSYSNTTSSITADLGGTSAIGDPASDLLFVAAVPTLTKTFLDNPVGAGETTTLEFTLTNTSPTSTATDLAFVDVFDVVLPTASVIPANGFCNGTGTASYTQLINPPPPSDAIPAQLTISGAELAPGASCTFSITLDVLVGAEVGTYTNTTTEVTATVDGATVTGGTASDDLQIVAAPTLNKEFLNDPVAAGDTVTLQFTLTMPGGEAGFTGTDITFSDDLTATLAGLAAIDTPLTNVCGGGSEITGTTNLTFSGGALGPGESCTFGVTLQVPANASSGAHGNTTSNVMATVLGVTALENPASDDLDIVGLTLTKEFTDDPVLPGGTVTLQFTITNGSQLAATDIVFSDNLDAVVDNLAVISAPAEPCGTGSTLTLLSSNTLMILQGGNLAAGASCTFSVPLQVPANAAPNTYTNVTSLFSGTLDGAVVSFGNAQDELTIASDLLTLSKEFTNDPVAPGGTVNLRFTLANTGTDTVSNIAFTDDLETALSGLAASGLPIAACGGTVSGTSVISLSGGTLAAGSSCTFDVAVSVPSTADPESTIVNTTSAVSGTQGGLAVTGDPATDELTIVNIRFAKSFAGDAPAGGTVVLTFNLENVGSTSLIDLGFTDDLNAVIVGLTATGLPMSNFCGAGSQLTGSSFLSFTGGNLLPGGSCTFSVTLQVPAGTEPGDYENVTSELLGESGVSIALPTTATVTVIAVTDSDDDGVLDDADFCDDTVIPESVPTVRLGTNRFALVDEDGIFDTKAPNGNDPRLTFTIEDTAGCSCEQIIEALDLGNGHTKFGCSISAMRDWTAFVGKAARDSALFRLFARQVDP